LSYTGIELYSDVIYYPHFQILLPDGLDVVDKIEEIGSQSGATAKPVVIAKSGEITD